MRAPTIDDAIRYAQANDLTVKTAHAILSRQYLIDEINNVTLIVETGDTQRNTGGKHERTHP